jgi:hypothetical protein
MVVGVVGQIGHTGGFFFPALVVLAIATAMLWREQQGNRRVSG